MKLKKNGKRLIPSKKDNKGYILTLVVIIMASVVTVVLTSVTLGSITRVKRSDTGLEQMKIEQFSEGCANDGLIRLNRDTGYSGETYDLRGGTCNISVSDSGSNKILSVTGTIDNYNHNLEIEVSTDPFKLIKWDS